MYLAGRVLHDCGVRSARETTMPIASYHCPACGRSYRAARPLWRCECGGHLNMMPGKGLARGEIASADASLWRYAAALALAGPPRVSLGEGWTPLVRRTWQGAEIRFKLESQMPTGSFKDRGTAVMINHLLEVAVGPIHEDSSGNAGASIATYAAAAGIPCRIYVPAAAPHGKLVQIAATGADVRAIPGTRQDVTEAALKVVGESFYASHNWQPFFIEGTKTLAYELWEQLGFRVPDNILVPTGYGSNILGLERGFDELEKTRRDRRAAASLCGAGGELRSLRRRLGGGREPASCRSRRDRRWPTGLPRRNRCASPRFCRRLRRSKGGVVAVVEEEIAPALAALGRCGLFVEPTAATAGAALTRLLGDGTIRGVSRPSSC